MKYHNRVWLNKKGKHSSGSVIAFHGKVQFGQKKEIVSVLEVADCHGKVRLHQAKSDTNKDFIKKMRKLAKVASRFADALEAPNAD